MNRNPITRTHQLRAAGKELGFSQPVIGAMTYVETFDMELRRRGLTWEDVPSELPVRALFAPNALGSLILRIAQATDPGFRLFERTVEEPGIRRDAVLGAYQRCLQQAPLPSELPEQ